MSFSLGDMMPGKTIWLHAGSGKRSFKLFALTVWIAVTLPSQAQEGWHSIYQISLNPGESIIALVEQLGSDLYLQVLQDGSILTTQEGPDYAYGTEVAVLKNPTLSPLKFSVQVAQVLHGQPVRYELTTLSSFTAYDLDLASEISKFSSAWNANIEREYDADILLQKTEMSSSTKLRQLAVKTYLDALAASGRSESLIQALESDIDFSDFPSAEQDYFSWQLAEALWEARYIDEAFDVISNLSERYESSTWLENIDPMVVQWLRTSMRATEGGIRVFAGISRGDSELLASGGTVLKNALAAIDDSPDFGLRGLLTDYLAGYYDQAEGRQSNIRNRLLEEAKYLYELSGENPRLASILNNQAHAALGRGELDESLQLYLQAIQVQKKSHHLEGKAHVLARLGYLYHSLGELRSAEIRFSEAIESYRALNLHRTAIHTELQYAELLQNSDRHEDALNLLIEVSLKIGSESPIEDQLRLNTQLANSYLELGDIDNAKASEALALKSLTESPESSLGVSSRLYYRLTQSALSARIALTEKDYASAAKIIDDGLKLTPTQETEPLEKLELLYLKLQLTRLQQDTESFIVIGKQISELIENLRTDLDLEAFGPQWSSLTNPIQSYLSTQFIELFHKTGNRQYLNQGFSILQNNRSRNLRESRLKNLQISTDTGKEQLQLEINKDRQSLITAILFDQPTIEIERRLSRREERYLLDFGGMNTPKKLDTLQIDSIQNNLNKKEVVYSYLLGEEFGFVIKISNSEVDIYRLPGEDVLSEQISVALERLETGTRFTASLKPLAEILLPGIDSSKQTLIIEADSLISRVPFGVLLDALDPAIKLASMQVPSLSEFYLNQNPNPDWQSERLEIAVFADPALSRNDDTNYDQFHEWQEQLGSLPFSRIEADAVIKNFDRQNSKVLIDRSATIEALVASDIRNSRILHIASHGFASTTDPLFLGLLLSSDEGNPANGLLTAPDISQNKFSNELVVISACETAGGQLLKGEGVMSLSRAFLASGAGATLSTLWPVSDRANSIFMREFYFALNELRYDAAGALSYAQAKLKESTSYGAPYYWGAFVLHVADAGYTPI